MVLDLAGPWFAPEAACRDGRASAPGSRPAAADAPSPNRARTQCARERGSPFPSWLVQIGSSTFRTCAVSIAATDRSPMTG